MQAIRTALFLVAASALFGTTATAAAANVLYTATGTFSSLENLSLACTHAVLRVTVTWYPSFCSRLTSDCLVYSASRLSK